MVGGGRCSYEEGTQLAQAVEFLHAHRRTTRLVTLDIGANDVQRCVSRSPLGIDLVATICAWTWMCRLGDIHANDTGYAVMAGAVVARL